MKILNAFVVFFLALSSLARADESALGESFARLLAEPIPTFIECTLRQTNEVSCGNVEAEFFATYGRLFRRVSNARDATLHARLTDQNVGNSVVRFTFRWEAKAPFVDKYYDPYYVNLDTGVLLEPVLRANLIAGLIKGGVVFLTIAHAETNAEGDIVLKVQNGTAEPPKDNIFTRLAKSPFSATLHGSANFSSTGDGRRNNHIGGGTSANHSTDRYRFIGSIDFSRVGVVQPDGNGGSLSAQNRSIHGSALAARSLGEKRRWNVAVFTTYFGTSHGNIRNDLMAGAGIEYTLVPYRVTQNKEFYIRAGSGLMALDLAFENDLGHLSENYHFVFSELAGFWSVYDGKLVLKGSGRIRVLPKYPGYERYSGTAGVTLRLNNTLSISPSYSLTYQKRSIIFPKAPDYSNPLQSQFLDGAPGINSSISVGVSINIGNTPKKASDRRWSSY